jgi:hypothetical protein
VATDNGSGYRSRSFAAACAQLAVGRRRTRPYTPRTNGKAERFIQTLLREWASSQNKARSPSSAPMRPHLSGATIAIVTAVLPNLKDRPLTPEDIARVLRAKAGLAAVVRLATVCAALVTRAARSPTDLSEMLDRGCRLTTSVQNSLDAGGLTPKDLPELQSFLTSAWDLLDELEAADRPLLSAVYNAAWATERMTHFKARDARIAACRSLTTSWNALRTSPGRVAELRALFVAAGFNPPDEPSESDQARLTFA